MEMPEFSSREQKPELDRSRPEAFFSYAAAKQRWLRSRISPQQISDALDDHALSLWAHIRDEYDDFPEVEVTTKNAYHTKGVAVKKTTDAGEELYSFGSEKLPLTGDAGLFGVHELRGRLYDFYRADNDEIRLYISTDAEEVKTPGGVYTPRISVSLEHSDIQFAEFGAKARMGVFENEVQAQLEHVTSDIIIRSLIEIRSALSSEATTCAQKLHELSPRLAAISRSKQATPQLIDALLGMVKVSLRLESSQNIRAQAYRQILTKEPTASHKPIKGTTDFLNVRPEFGLIGESDAKSLALFVLYDDASVQIPVQYITQIQKAE